MSAEPVMVTMRHVRIAKMCSGGARDFFKRYNLDWNRFIKEGIPAEELEALDNAVANQAVKVARDERK